MKLGFSMAIFKGITGCDSVLSQQGTHDAVELCRTGKSPLPITSHQLSSAALGVSGVIGVS
jgi:hypothetical protein